MKATWHPIPIYKARVKIVHEVSDIPPPRDGSNRVVAGFDALCGPVGEAGSIYMWYDLDYVTLGTIAHECLHACNFILQSRGVLADRHNDEPDAYLLGYLVDHVVKVLRKRGATL